MATVLGSCLIVLGAAVVFAALLGAGAYTLDWLHRRVVEPWRVRVAQAEYDRSEGVGRGGASPGAAWGDRGDGRGEAERVERACPKPTWKAVQRDSR